MTEEEVLRAMEPNELRPLQRERRDGVKPGDTKCLDGNP
jgi:hypothetical protein